MSVAMGFIRVEEGEELVIAEMEEGISFAFAFLLEIEDIGVELDRFFEITDLENDVITAKYMYGHWISFCFYRLIHTFRGLSNSIGRSFP